MTRSETKTETPKMDDMARFEPIAGSLAATFAAVAAGWEALRPSMEKLALAVAAERKKPPFWAVDPTKSRRR